METRPIFFLLALLVATGAFAEAYTWTDDEGVVHFSDRPHPGATIVDLGKSSSARPRPTTRPSSSANDEVVEQPATTGYTSIEITSPAAEETLWNIEGTLDVRVTLSPLLRQGHLVRVYFDGEPRMVNSAYFQISEVYRGVHNLQVEVIDETGQLVKRSRPTRFYVQQNSIL